MGSANSSICKNQQGVVWVGGETISVDDSDINVNMQGTMLDMPNDWEVQWSSEAAFHPQVGNCVKTTSRGKRTSDSKPIGAVGTLIQDDGSNLPFEVQFSAGTKGWYTMGELEPYYKYGHTDIFATGPSKHVAEVPFRPRLASNAANAVAMEATCIESRSLRQDNCAEQCGPEFESNLKETDTLGVPLTWDTPSGIKTVYATEKVLGLQFSPSLPVKISREQEGHGKDLGVEVGWSLRSVNGVDITCKTSFREVMKILHREVGLKPAPKPKQPEQRKVQLTWDTPHGEKTVLATEKMFGLHFPSSLPITISREQEGHGKDIGIEVGWTLKNINGIDIAGRTDFKEVMKILHKQVGLKPGPVR
jgi:hypothetical protein